LTQLQNNFIFQHFRCQRADAAEVGRATLQTDVSEQEVVRQQNQLDITAQTISTQVLAFLARAPHHGHLTGV
jgi:hypothetical protein